MPKKLPDAVQWYNSHVAGDHRSKARNPRSGLKKHPDDDGQPLVAKGSEKRSSGDVYWEAKAFKERFLALEAKRSHLEALGKLMDAGEAQSAIFKIGAEVRQRLEVIPFAIAPVLGAIVGKEYEQKIQQILQQQVHDVLDGLAAGIEQWGQAGEDNEQKS